MLRTTTIDFDSRFFRSCFFLFLWRDCYFQLKFNRGMSFSSKKDKFFLWIFTIVLKSKRYNFKWSRVSSTSFDMIRSMTSCLITRANNAQPSWNFLLLSQFFLTRNTKNRDYKRILRKQEVYNLIQYSMSTTQFRKHPITYRSFLFFIFPEFYKRARWSIEVKTQPYFERASRDSAFWDESTRVTFIFLEKRK